MLLPIEEKRVNTKSRFSTEVVFRDRFGVGVFLVSLIHMALSLVDALSFGSQSEFSPTWMYAILNSALIGEIILRITSLGLLSLRDILNTIDLVAGICALFDSVRNLVYEIPALTYLRIAWCIRVLRIFRSASLIHSASTRPSSFAQLYRACLAVGYNIVYSAVYFIFVALLVSLFVTADILPSLPHLRIHADIPWVSARVFFGSIKNTMFSVFEAVTLDNWYTSLGRDLASSGKGLVLITMTVAVLAGNLAYTNILLGCMVDKSVELVQDTNDRSAALSRINQEGNLRLLLTKFMEYLRTQNNSTKQVSLQSLLDWIELNEQRATELWALDLGTHQVRHLFKLVDSNNIGQVRFDDLCLGFIRYRGEGSGQDLIHLSSMEAKALSLAENSLKSLTGQVESLAEIRSSIDEFLSVYKSALYREGNNRILQRRDQDRGRNRMNLKNALRSTGGTNRLSA